MAELKTKQNEGSPSDYLDAIENEARRNDAYAILKMMQSITKEKPRMWGKSIVGFGTYHYVYATGREGDWFLTGFSSRKDSLTLYIMAGFEEYDDLLKKLGKFKTGKSCLYIKSLNDVHLPTLKELIKKSADFISTKKWP